MPNAITFYQGVQSDYDSLTTKDPYGIYFLEDSAAIYKNDIKYGGSEVDIATSSTAGIIIPGTDFDIAADGTLSLYQAMSISSFSVNTASVENGSSVSTATFSWVANKVPTTLTLSYSGGNVSPTLATSGSYTYVFPTALTSTTAFTLTAADARNATSTKTLNISFLNGKYYGVSTVSSADDIDDAFIQSLTKTLTSSRTGSWTVNAGSGQYIYFAVPASFGTPAFYVGGFEGGFDLLKTFDYTNSAGATVSYNVYKSTQAGLGSTTVEVK